MLDFIKKLLGKKSQSSDTPPGVNPLEELAKKSIGYTDPPKTEERQRLDLPLKNDIICDRYEVKGKSLETGRMRTRELIAWDQESDKTILERLQMTEPYEIQKIGLEPPSEAQRRYARDLGIHIPADASKRDVSIFISRVLNDEPVRQPKAPNDILEVLIKQMGIYVPAYAGKAEMNGAFYASMDAQEQYAYFAMKVYAQSAGKNYRFLHDATLDERTKCYEFAREYREDRSFTESYSRYKLDELFIGEKIKRKLRAYELVIAFFLNYQEK